MAVGFAPAAMSLTTVGVAVGSAEVCDDDEDDDDDDDDVLVVVDGEALVASSSSDPQAATNIVSASIALTIETTANCPNLKPFRVLFIFALSLGSDLNKPLPME